MVVISIRALSDGAVIGSCCAHCYEAPPHTRCTCVCGGANHGKGSTYALAHTDALIEKWKHVASVQLHPGSQQTTIPGIFDS